MYIPSRSPKTRDITVSADWVTGEAVYIHFAVQDTGRGLTEEERGKLFQRFSQANSRTHVTYGRSGLGLFICRELVELQGGETGVASESGKGSTFAFYIKARRCHAPSTGFIEDQLEIIHRRKSSLREDSDHEVGGGPGAYAAFGGGKSLALLSPGLRPPLPRIRLHSRWTNLRFCSLKIT